MVFLLVLGLPSALAGFFFLVLAIRSKNPKNIVSTYGELTRKKGYKNYKMQHFSVPVMTEYTYTYVVDGKQYQLSGKQRTTPRNIRKRIPIVYLRGFPRCAYEGDAFGVAEWVVAIAFIATGAFCISISFFVT